MLLSNVKCGCGVVVGVVVSISDEEGLGLLEGGRSVVLDSCCAMRCVLPPSRSSSAGVRDTTGGLLVLVLWIASWPFARSFLIDS